jgi:hypothetical protein
VLYADGFRGTGLELTVTNPRIRQYLLTNGYAWAASSYSKNGYDVRQGVKDSHALGEFFNGFPSGAALSLLAPFRSHARQGDSATRCNRMRLVRTQHRRR